MKEVWYKTEFITESGLTISIYGDEGSLAMDIINHAGNSLEVVNLNEAEAHLLARKLMEMSKDIFPKSVESINCKNEEEKRAGEIWEKYMNNPHNPYRVNL